DGCQHDRDGCRG
ncbi:hypothetical protein BN1723_020972, partial [Verticillium longisporum]